MKKPTAPNETLPAPQGTLNALVTGLGVKDEPNVSTVDRFGPLVAIVVYAVCMLLLAFELVPNPSGLLSLTALLGPVVGAWAGKLGAK